MATPCWPAPVSAMTRVLPSRRVSSAWPSALLILCAPVWARSSRLRYSRSAGISASSPGRAAARRRRACGADGLGEAVGAVERRRAPGEPRRGARAARPRRPGPGGGRRRPSRAARAPPSASRGRSGRRSRAPSPSGRGRRHRAGPASTGVGPNGTFGRSSRAAAGALAEQRDEVRVLARAPPGLARRLDPRRDVHPGGGDRAQGLGDVRRSQAAGQRHGQLPGDRGGQGRVRALAGPAGMRAAGRVEQQALRSGRRATPGRARRPRRRPRRRPAAPRPADGAPSRPAGPTDPIAASGSSR